MSHIKDRLKRYKDKYSGSYKYAGVYVKVIQDMIEQLLADRGTGFCREQSCQSAE